MKIKRMISILLILILAVSGCSSSPEKSSTEKSSIKKTTNENKENEKEAPLPDISMEDAKKNIINLKDNIKSATIEGKKEIKGIENGSNRVKTTVVDNIKGEYLKKDGKETYLAMVNQKSSNSDSSYYDKFDLFKEGDNPIMMREDGQDYKETDDMIMEMYLKYYLPCIYKNDVIGHLITLVGDSATLEQDGYTYTLSIGINGEKFMEIFSTLDFETREDLSLLAGDMISTKCRIVMDKKTNLPKEQTIVIESKHFGGDDRDIETFTSKFISINDLKEVKME